MAESVAEKLDKLGFKRGILLKMAKDGFITQLRCEMPRCFSPDGRDVFAMKVHPPARWQPSADHFPKLRSQGGRFTVDNVRLSHILCNNLDYTWQALPREKRAEAVARWSQTFSGRSPDYCDS